MLKPLGALSGLPLARRGTYGPPRTKRSTEVPLCPLIVLVVALAALFVSEAVRILALDSGSPTAAGNPLFVPAFVLSLIGTTLFVGSFPVTYVRQAVEAGKTGLVGLVAYIGAGLV